MTWTTLNALYSSFVSLLLLNDNKEMTAWNEGIFKSVKCWLINKDMLYLSIEQKSTKTHFNYRKWESFFAGAKSKEEITEK